MSANSENNQPPSKGNPMKLLIASIFALSLMGATAASADVIGVHVGPAHVGIGVHHHHHCWYRHHHRVCN